MSGQGAYFGFPSPRCSTSMIATHVSRPIRSASASGPIGCAKPSLAIVSIASGSATPSSNAYAASLMNGIRIRFETKPGKSRASAGSLPRSRASCVIAAAVSSEVSSPRITSTSLSHDLRDAAAHLPGSDEEDVLEIQERSLDVDQDRVARAAARADRREAETAAVATQLVHDRGENPSARGADRVPERDRAAVD